MPVLRLCSHNFRGVTGPSCQKSEDFARKNFIFLDDNHSLAFWLPQIYGNPHEILDLLETELSLHRFIHGLLDNLCRQSLGGMVESLHRRFESIGVFLRQGCAHLGYG